MEPAFLRTLEANSYFFSSFFISPPAGAAGWAGCSAAGGGAGVGAGAGAAIGAGAGAGDCFSQPTSNATADNEARVKSFFMSFLFEKDESIYGESVAAMTLVGAATVKRVDGSPISPGRAL